MSQEQPPPPPKGKHKSRVLAFAIAGLLLGGMFSGLGAVTSKDRDRENPENRNFGYLAGSIVGGMCCPGLIGAGIGWLLGPVKEK